MSHDRKISVIGLGYVGLPVAVAFGIAGQRVIGFDINPARINTLIAGHDHTGEVEDQDLARAGLTLTTDPALLREADFHIITVPTPIDRARRPDLGPLRAASRTVGAILKKGDIVVYESTVYPGATEEDCVPLLEEGSGLVCGRDFTVGYSPERINPGDREHRFTTIRKVVSGSDAATLEVVAAVYGSVVTAGIHRAPSIQAAEAAKVVENTQRDLNIALMNELSLIFGRLGVDTRDVLEAAGTKWNFLPFTPGLVGGHCIGVDPYYLTYCAEQAGYRPEVILAGRRINDTMGAHVAREVLRLLLRRPRQGGGLHVVILGLTFKENVPDIRNTRVVDIAEELHSFGVTVEIVDPLADPAEVKAEYAMTLASPDALRPAHGVILAVAHDTYRTGGWELVARLLEGGQGVVADVKGVLDRAACPAGIDLWRL
ncbi:nucleotide sugar dehydrogenase [Pararhodospirillum oryzae]|uniref:UDP-N-acetyl-D-galactosamine dehydrogenase n=1 Tax=Pararhodospirillum oryzae TaxID=478448 RepID=A0A512H9S1_9PROT|nr:nucleotide sugar dehydrogenase [Pararhodospirillum oryzae]GEO82178.1 UDP-N-acetyl-D-galactosamine dehydrogenase [Pararhodospirillum oryzae]